MAETYDKQAHEELCDSISEAFHSMRSEGEIYEVHVKKDIACSCQDALRIKTTITVERFATKDELKRTTLEI